MVWRLEPLPQQNLLEARDVKLAHAGPPPCIRRPIRTLSTGRCGSQEGLGREAVPPKTLRSFLRADLSGVITSHVPRRQTHEPRRAMAREDNSDQGKVKPQGQAATRPREDAKRRATNGNQRGMFLPESGR